MCLKMFNAKVRSMYSTGSSLLVSKRPLSLIKDGPLVKSLIKSVLALTQLLHFSFFTKIETANVFSIELNPVGQMGAS
jgi:hypothetical protein